MTYGEGALVLRAELSVYDRIRKLKIGLGLLISLEHVHAATEIVINSSCVDRVSAEAFFSYLSCLQKASESPRRFVNVVKYGPQAAVRERLVRVVVGKLNLCDSVDVVRDSDLILATRFVDRPETHHEEELLFGPQFVIDCIDWLSLRNCRLATEAGLLLLDCLLNYGRVLNVPPELPGLLKRAHCHLIVCRVLVDEGRLDQSCDLWWRCRREEHFLDEAGHDAWVLLVAP